MLILVFQLWRSEHTQLPRLYNVRDRIYSSEEAFCLSGKPGVLFLPKLGNLQEKMPSFRATRQGHLEKRSRAWHSLRYPAEGKL